MTSKTLAPTDQIVIDSDQLQERMQEGPCFDAAHTRFGERVFRIADFTAHIQRWPAYTPPARQLGLGSMMGFLLYTEEEDLGALNLYSRQPGAFTEASETVGWLLASHAAVAFSGARTHAQMEQAIATRHTIGEAMGILMGSRHLTETQASTSCAATRRRRTSSFATSPAECASREFSEEAGAAARTERFPRHLDRTGGISAGRAPMGRGRRPGLKSRVPSPFSLIPGNQVRCRDGRPAPSACQQTRTPLGHLRRVGD